MEKYRLYTHSYSPAGIPGKKRERIELLLRFYINSIEGIQRDPGIFVTPSFSTSPGYSSGYSRFFTNSDGSTVY